MKIAIFGGTTEGRKIIDYLGNEDINVDVFVATTQGKDVLEKYDNVQVLVGRKEEEEIKDIFINNKYDLVVDATHPYALKVTENITHVCSLLNIEYLRITRNIYEDKATYNDYDEVIEFLNNHEGNVFITTGSKELSKYIKVNNYLDRLYVRVLPTVDAINECLKIGLKSSHIIAMQGPFSIDANKCVLKDYNIKYMVSKLGGSAGGYLEKEEACNSLGVKLLSIGISNPTIGLSIDEGLKKLSSLVNIKKHICIIGCGLGNKLSMTMDAIKAIDEATLVIGSKRITAGINDKEIINEFRENKIKEIINDTYHKNICVLFSGDVGFYSGAKAIMDLNKEYDVRIIPGISSYVYLASLVNVTYEDMVLTSLHGRSNNIINIVATNRKVFTLLGGDTNVNDLLELLIEYKLDNCYLYIGENLSYDIEKITFGYVKDLINKEYSSLASVIIINDQYEKYLQLSIDDLDFIKDKSPMTKEDVRTLSVAKLNLESTSVLYDVGAGTGSVSVMGAKLCYLGKVFAIEKNEEAIDTLQLNKIKFKCQNIEVIHGFAPNVFSDLEKPTHAFIGGSSGNLEEIINSLFSLNENIRIVLNAITMDTISKAYEIGKRYNLKMDITMVNISKDNEVGSYHLMKANNPVYIFVFEK